MQRVLTGNHHANRLLSSLEQEDFAALEPYLEVVNLPRGTVIYDTGDFIRYAYFPHGAIVSLVNVLEDGRTVEVAVFGCEGVFGLLSALVTRESFGRYVVQVPGTASRILFDRLNEVRNTHPALRQTIMRYGEALLARTFQMLTCNAVHNLEQRCCTWILSIQDRVGHEMLPLTHEFLAEMLAVQRSTVTGVLGALQAKDYIVLRRGAIAVTDRAGLEKTACECHCKIQRIFERLLPRTQAYVRSAH